ncbi:MAG: fumarylacetoacetate hydrolase family protein [Gammaproteobacteria bacterium]
MKLLTFATAERGSSFGAVQGAGVIDLGARLTGRCSSVRQALEIGALPELAALAERATADHALSDIRFLRPILQPEKIICVGVNYGNRNAEYRDDSEQPQYPSIFMRTADSLVGHREAILRPPESVQLDYEGEIAIVIGKRGRRIPEAQAEQHIAGLTLINEGSIRDWLRHGKFNVTQGKNFDASGAIGPWLVTADEFSGYEDLTLTTTVNGERRQHDTTANLLFPFRYLIHYISTWTTLKPGDVIATGTPSGAGARFNPPRYLQAGDCVEVTVAGIGTLSNTVSDEPP